MTKYRQIALNHQVDSAITDICNEAIIIDDEREIVELDTEDIPFSVPVKEILAQEFKEVLNLLEFKIRAYEIFTRFYVDGRLYYHAMIDPKNPKVGIQEMRYLDPRKIRKIKEMSKSGSPQATNVQGGDSIQKLVNEYYIYNDKGLDNTSSSMPGVAGPVTGIKIAKDTVVHVTSGMIDAKQTLVIGWLHKAIRPTNLYATIENAMVIYRLARAPERRVFYVDIGNLPAVKAEQYVKNMMTQYKNKVVYDSDSGVVRDDRKFMTMLEDFWFPTRGERGTKIDTLPGSVNTGVLEEVEYFKRELYQALNVPFSRNNPDQMYTYGASAEISRDEVKFGMFIDRIRLRFNDLFLKTMERNLLLKGLVTPEEWDELVHHIKFKYARNTLLSELKESQLMTMRMQNLQLMMPFVGRYYSNEYIRRKVLFQTDDDMQAIDTQIYEESKNPQYAVPVEPGNES